MRAVAQEEDYCCTESLELDQLVGEAAVICVESWSFRSAEDEMRGDFCHLDGLGEADAEEVAIQVPRRVWVLRARGGFGEEAVEEESAVLEVE